MRLIVENIHGNSKVSELGGWLWGRQIMIVPRSHREGQEYFTELYNFFTHSLGPSVDVQTLNTLYPQPQAKWCYQLEPKYSNHRFFVKDAKDLSWFHLKYSQDQACQSR